MKAIVSNGLTIDRYIPPQLRNTFYKNTNRRYMRNNGLDPYGFSTEGLVLYLPLWALKESSFKSVDAYKHTATVTGALWRPDGRFFDGGGAADDFITVPNTASIDNIWDGGGTISLWINPASDGEAGQGRLCDKFGSGVGRIFRVGDEAGGFMKVTFYIAFSGNDAHFKSTSADIPINSWTYFSVTYNADATANVPIFYVNGSVSNHDVVTPPTGTRDSDAGIDMTIGNNLATAATFDGLIGEVGMYNRILTVGEITQNVNATAWRYQ